MHESPPSEARPELLYDLIVAYVDVEVVVELGHYRLDSLVQIPPLVERGTVVVEVRTRLEEGIAIVPLVVVPVEEGGRHRGRAVSHPGIIGRVVPRGSAVGVGVLVAVREGGGQRMIRRGVGGVVHAIAVTAPLGAPVPSILLAAGGRKGARSPRGLVRRAGGGGADDGVVVPHLLHHVANARHRRPPGFVGRGGCGRRRDRRRRIGRRLLTLPFLLLPLLLLLLLRTFFYFIVVVVILLGDDGDARALATASASAPAPPPPGHERHPPGDLDLQITPDHACRIARGGRGGIVELQCDAHERDRGYQTQQSEVRYDVVLGRDEHGPEDEGASDPELVAVESDARGHGPFVLGEPRSGEEGGGALVQRLGEPD